MTDINEIRFSGTIERLQAVTTKTGTSMARWLLKVGQDRFKCVAFKNVADAVLQCNDGDRVSLTGTGAINSLKDSEDHWHNDFQVSAWVIEIAGKTISYDKPTKLGPVTKSQQQSVPTQAPQQDSRGLSEFDASPVGEVPF